MLDPIIQQYYLRARFYNPVGYVDPSGHSICPTQLSLYKKYKEFFAKKMPKAKKKAYEYMRKKIGIDSR